MIPYYLQRLDGMLVHLPFPHGEDREHASLVEHWDVISTSKRVSRECSSYRTLSLRTLSTTRRDNEQRCQKYLVIMRAADHFKLH